MTHSQYIEEHNDTDSPFAERSIIVTLCSLCGWAIHGKYWRLDKTILCPHCESEYALTDKQALQEWFKLRMKDDSAEVVEQTATYIWDLLDCQKFISAADALRLIAGESLAEYLAWYYSSWCKCDTKDGD